MIKMEFNGTTVAPSTYTLHDGSKIEIPAGRHIKHWSYWCACSTYALGPQTHTRTHTLQTLLLVYNRASRCASHPPSHRRDRDVLPRDQEVHQARGPHGEFIWGSRGCPRSPRICCRGAVGRQGRWATHLPPPIRCALPLPAHCPLSLPATHRPLSFTSTIHAAPSILPLLSPLPPRNLPASMALEMLQNWSQVDQVTDPSTGLPRGNYTFFAPSNRVRASHP